MTPVKVLMHSKILIYSYFLSTKYIETQHTRLQVPYLYDNMLKKDQLHQ